MLNLWLRTLYAMLTSIPTTRRGRSVNFMLWYKPADVAAIRERKSGAALFAGRPLRPSSRALPAFGRTSPRLAAHLYGRPRRGFRRLWDAEASSSSCRPSVRSSPKTGLEDFGVVGRSKRLSHLRRPYLQSVASACLHKTPHVAGQVSGLRSASTGQGGGLRCRRG
jgi:hypothetical protein